MQRSITVVTPRCWPFLDVSSLNSAAFALAGAALFFVQGRLLLCCFMAQRQPNSAARGNSVASGTSPAAWRRRVSERHLGESQRLMLPGAGAKRDHH